MADNRLKLVIERNIPFIAGVADVYADVEYLAADAITREAVADADAIVVRTRTRCGRDLLEGSRVRMVVTATIGTDHIDMEYCRTKGIEVRNAPGCNAPAVAQYVLASVATLMNRPIEQHTIGIVGVGHVGKIVERWARALDMRVLLCDPPRAREEGPKAFTDLDTIAREADIITFHTPLTTDGEDATFHMADKAFFGKLRRAPIVINAARGGVADTDALTEAIRAGIAGHAVVDCWENEPDISTELLELASVATPHIAGYSLQGKVRASQMALDALSDFFGLPGMKADAPEECRSTAVAKTVTVQALELSYLPMDDTQTLRNNPKNFEALRNNYDYRQEPQTGKID